jgi:hypothetical protein
VSRQIYRISLPAKGIIFSIGTDQRSENDLLIFAFLLQADIALHQNWDLKFEGDFSYHGIKGLKNLYLYRFEHISNPFKKDSGINTHAMNLGISF